eukprot:2892042-Alexandrium_andersonii.AAC.1
MCLRAPESARKHAEVPETPLKAPESARRHFKAREKQTNVPESDRKCSNTPEQSEGARKRFESTRLRPKAS